jgi:hypothetical protein
MQEMLRQYILDNSQTSVETSQFRNAWETYVQNKYDDVDKINDILSKMDWGAWIYQPGLPPQVLNFTTENITKAINMADAYITGAG